MIRLKPGAQLAILRPEIWSILTYVDSAYESLNASCVITCGTDGHPADDPHTHGFALDFRTHGLRPGEAEDLHRSLEDALGDRYTVLFENGGLPGEHIHIQLRKDLWHQIVASELQ